MSLLLLGAKGQVGGAWLKHLAPIEVLAWSRDDLDLQNLPKVEQTLRGLPQNIQGIVNCAAFTQVDRAETEREAALTLNEALPKLLAQWCKERDIPLLHYSTEFVFDGEGNQPHHEEDPTHPVNWYGETKRRGEIAVQNSGSKHLILRTSWVYDFSARNFLSSIAKFAKEKEVLDVVQDQVGAPTYARELAQASYQAFRKANAFETYPSGIYHLCHRGEVSRYDFAQTIVTKLRDRGVELKVKEIRPTPSASFPTAARRPLNSRMSTAKIERILGVALPTWQEGLESCLQKEL